MHKGVTTGQGMDTHTYIGVMHGYAYRCHAWLGMAGMAMHIGVMHGWACRMLGCLDVRMA
jgi:hypothetical protein